MVTYFSHPPVALFCGFYIAIWTLLVYFVCIISPGIDPNQTGLVYHGHEEGVPFPALIEALIMEVAIEILREGGRLPKPIGPAMGIVGGLVIGEAPYKRDCESNYGDRGGVNRHFFLCHPSIQRWDYVSYASFYSHVFAQCLDYTVSFCFPFLLTI